MFGIFTNSTQYQVTAAAEDHGIRLRSVKQWSGSKGMVCTILTEDSSYAAVQSMCHNLPFCSQNPLIMSMLAD